MRRALALVALLTLTGCGDDPPTDEDPGPICEDGVTEVPIIDPHDWAPATGDHPFVAFAPPEEDCAREAFIYEQLGPQVFYEINTDLCDGGTAAIPTIEAVTAGETVHMDLFHFDLSGPEGAEGHMEIAFGDEVVFSHTIPMPSGALVVRGEWVPDQDVPIGTVMTFHARNHGTNQYAAGPVYVERPCE
ncbi:MAG: hypothetical protein KDA28_17590 [Phycisphaerales bacterium]|nr:hypothetical protein [Phycisphaerales bacterium]